MNIYKKESFINVLFNKPKMRSCVYRIIRMCIIFANWNVASLGQTKRKIK